MKHLNHPYPHLLLFPSANDNSRESKKDEPTYIVITLPLKATPTPSLQIQKPIVPFPNRLKGKKEQAYINKMREIFS